MGKKSQFRDQADPEVTTKDGQKKSGNDKKSKSCSIKMAASVVMMGVGIVLTAYFMSIIADSREICIGDFFLLCLGLSPVVAGAIIFGKLYRIKTQRHMMWREAVAFFGILLILIGLFFLFLNTGLLDRKWESVLISWQMFLLLLGIINFGRVRVVWGTFLTVTGVFFIVSKLITKIPDSSVFSDTFVQTYWPVLLITSGLVVVLAILYRLNVFSWLFKNNDFKKDYSRDTKDLSGFTDFKTEDGTLNYKLKFTELKQKNFKTVFRGGKISGVFACIELNLGNTSLPAGTSYLRINLVFAGMILHAPSSWNIEVRSTSVMGGFVDNRPKTSESKDNYTLVILANCVLGGGEIIVVTP